MVEREAAQRIGAVIGCMHRKCAVRWRGHAPTQPQNLYQYARVEPGTRQPVEVRTVSRRDAPRAPLPPIPPRHFVTRRAMFGTEGRDVTEGNLGSGAVGSPLFVI